MHARKNEQQPLLRVQAHTSSSFWSFCSWHAVRIMNDGRKWTVRADMMGCDCSGVACYFDLNLRAGRPGSLWPPVVLTCSNFAAHFRASKRYCPRGTRALSSRQPATMSPPPPKSSKGKLIYELTTRSSALRCGVASVRHRSRRGSRNVSWENV